MIQAIIPHGEATTRQSPQPDTIAHWLGALFWKITSMGEERKRTWNKEARSSCPQVCSQEFRQIQWKFGAGSRFVRLSSFFVKKGHFTPPDSGARLRIAGETLLERWRIQRSAYSG